MPMLVKKLLAKHRIRHKNEEPSKNQHEESSDMSKYAIATPKKMGGKSVKISTKNSPLVKPKKNIKGVFKIETTNFYNLYKIVKVCKN